MDGRTDGWMQAAYFLSCHRSLHLNLPLHCHCSVPHHSFRLPVPSPSHSHSSRPLTPLTSRAVALPLAAAAAVVRKPLSEKRVLQPNERAFVCKTSLSFFLSSALLLLSSLRLNCISPSSDIFEMVSHDWESFLPNPLDQWRRNHACGRNGDSGFHLHGCQVFTRRFQKAVYTHVHPAI